MGFFSGARLLPLLVLVGNSLAVTFAPPIAASAVTPDYVCTLSDTENCDLDNYSVGDIIQVSMR